MQNHFKGGSMHKPKYSCDFCQGMQKLFKQMDLPKWLTAIEKGNYYILYHEIKTLEQQYIKFARERK